MTATPEPLRVIFTAIRTAYSANDHAYIAYKEYFDYLSKPDPNAEFSSEMEALLAKITKLKHFSVLEHVSFTFGIRCVSRSTIAQLTRRRVGWSYTVQSQRFVKQANGKGEFEYIIPPEVESDPKLKELYEDTMDSIQNTYDGLIEEGIDPGDARYVFPNAATSNITVTCNLRSFLELWENRDKAAYEQWELKRLAEKMKDEILKMEPGLEFLFRGE